jgi:hypothetical protein
MQNKRNKGVRTMIRRYCWCGAPALKDFVVFKTVAEEGERNVEYGYCHEHANQWRVKHPLIFIDGIGVKTREQLDAVYEQAKQTSAQWIDYLSYFPCVFEGEGTYSDRQHETLQEMLTEYKYIVEQHYRDRKPLVVVNNPFTQILGSPQFADYPHRHRLALKYLYRPSVWMLVNTSPLAKYDVHETMKLANKTTPLTYIYFTEGFGINKRSAWSYWNSAIMLFRQQATNTGKKTNRGG